MPDLDDDPRDAPLMAQVEFTEWLGMKEELNRLTRELHQARAEIQSRRQCRGLTQTSTLPACERLREALEEMLHTFGRPEQVEALEESGTAIDVVECAVIARARKALES